MPDKCLMPKDPGPCKAYYEKYFYNSEANACQIFGWGGCGGNDNQFQSLEECQSFCV